MSTEHPTDLLEAYALGTLDPDEGAVVETHLGGCPLCRREVAAYDEVTAALPDALAAASPLAPPADLRARVLQSVQAEAVPGSIRGGTAQRSGARARMWRAFTGTLRRPATAAVAALLVLLVGSIIWNTRLSRTLANERSIRAELAERVGYQEVVLEVVDSPRTVKAQLRASNGGSSAYGKLYTRPDLSYVVLMAGRLPPPPEGQQYQVWLTSGGETRSAGVLDVNDQGFGLLVLDSGQVGPVYEAAQVTLQPAGADAPEGSPVIAWRTTN